MAGASRGRRNNMAEVQPITVTWNTVEGAELSQTADTVTAKRTGLVTGIEGDLSKVFTQPGIPRIGDPYPGMGPPFATKITVRPEAGDPGTAHVLVEYGQPDTAAEGGIGWQLPLEPEPPQIEVSTVVVPVQTERDIDGNQITVTHAFTYPEDEHPQIVKPEDPTDTRDVWVGDVYRGGIVTKRSTTKRKLWVEQVGSVQTWEPQTVVRLRRRERKPPGDKSKGYVGHLNRDRVFGDPEKTWLCTEIRGASSDGGETYAVTYAFQRLGDTASPTIVFQDPETGGPVSAPIENEGFKDVDVLPTAAFRLLRLGI